MVNHRLVQSLALTLFLLLTGRLSAGVDRWTPQGPDGGAVTAVAAPSGVGGLVFAGTETAGVFVSRDGGTSWQPARTGLPSGERIRFVTAGGRNGRSLYAVTGTSVFASENGGGSWTRRVLPIRLIEDGTIYTGILSFAASPDAQTVFVGYRAPGSAQYLFRSTDGGRSWSRVDNGVGRTYAWLGMIVLAPSTPATVYMAVRDSQGQILRSTDNGSTWSLVSTLEGGAYGDNARIAVHPRDANILYAALAAVVYQSTDGGVSWTRLGEVVPAHEVQIAADLVINPVTPSTIYFAFNRRVPGYSGWYDGGIIKYEGWIYRSTNGGASWSQVAVSDMVAALGIDSLQPRRLYAGVSRIGILRSENRGAAWSRSNRGLRAASLCAVTPDPFTRDLLYISAGVCQESWEDFADNDDLGFLKADRTRSWVNVSSDLRNPIRVLEAYALVPDPKVAGTLYAATGHGLFKSVDGGGQWESLQSGLGPILEAVLSVAVDPGDPRILYAAGFKLGYPYCGGFCPLEPVWDVAKSTDGGATWTKLLPASLGGGLDITVDPQDPRVLYVPDLRERLLKSTDRGATWTARPVEVAGLPLPRLSRLVIDPASPQTLYAFAYSSQFDIRTVVKSTNGGQSWAKISQRLPEADYRDLVLDPERPATLYLATSEGVFVSEDAGARWSTLSKGLTNRDVYRVQVDPFDHATIYAGTEGDGGLFVLTRSDR